MKTILHIGAPKTGSTALQGSLAASYEPLVAQGVLYPLSNTMFDQHGFLTLPIRRGSRMPRAFNNYTYYNRSQGYKQLVGEINDQIAKTRPATLVVSSEFFFSCYEPGDRGPLKDVLRQIQSNEVTIVAYVRRFSDHFLSNLQQKFLAASTVQRPAAPNFRRTLEFYSEFFGRQQVCVFPFQRDGMVRGDILYDFADKMFAPLGVASGQLVSAGVQNRSLSAESFDIQRMFRRDFFTDNENVHKPESGHLFKELLNIDADVCAPRPRLQEQIALDIDHGSHQPLWLREKFGIEFTGIDYAYLAKRGPVKVEKRSYALSELVEIDRNVQAIILDRLCASAWAKKDDAFGEWAQTRLLDSLSGR